MRLFTFFVLALLAGSASAQSTVQINYGGLDFRTNSNTTVTDGSLVLLLANVATSTTAGIGFGNTLSAGSLNLGDLLSGTYQILGRAEADSSFGTTGSANLTLTSGQYPNLSTGDQLAIAWFPTLTAASSFSLINGVSYGLFTVNASTAWQVPAGGSTLPTINVPDGIQAAFLSTSAIPEPSTYAALLGVAVLGLAFHRRRRRALR
jgi:hypothetical protein